MEFTLSPPPRDRLKMAFKYLGRRDVFGPQCEAIGDPNRSFGTDVTLHLAQRGLRRVTTADVEAVLAVNRRDDQVPGHCLRVLRLLPPRTIGREAPKGTIGCYSVLICTLRGFAFAPVPSTRTDAARDLFVSSSRVTSMPARACTSQR